MSTYTSQVGLEADVRDGHVVQKSAVGGVPYIFVKRVCFDNSHQGDKTDERQHPKHSALDFGLTLSVHS